MRYVKGNLVDAKERIIAHGCNAQGKMGKGVALDIKNKWPLAYQLYVNRHKVRPLKLGEVVSAPVDDKIICNLITQEFYGYGRRFVNYAAVLVCLDKVALAFEGVDAPTGEIAISKIGAKNGGGDWKIIETMILDLERMRNVEFVIYSLDN